jgi:flagellar protein FliS
MEAAVDPLRQAYLASHIQTADSLTLVRILYDHAWHSTKKARELLRSGDIAGRSRAISQAGEALGLLTSFLDPDRDDEITRNLLGLYSYMQTRLLEANLKQSDTLLAEVENLLTPLRSAWAQLTDREQPSGPKLDG